MKPTILIRNRFEHPAVLGGKVIDALIRSGRQQSVELFHSQFNNCCSPGEALQLCRRYVNVCIEDEA